MGGEETITCAMVVTTVFGGGGDDIFVVDGFANTVIYGDGASGIEMAT